MASKKKHLGAGTLNSPSLLKQLAARPEKLISSSFKQQYAALCFLMSETGGVEILLITSRDTGRWVIPKGWPMKGKLPHEAAATEAFEEAGIKGIARPEPIGRYTYLKQLDNGDVAPTVVDVFQVEVVANAKSFKEQGQRILRWFSPDEAARRVREVELKSLIIEFITRGDT